MCISIHDTAYGSLCCCRPCMAIDCCWFGSTHFRHCSARQHQQWQWPCVSLLAAARCLQGTAPQVCCCLNDATMWPTAVRCCCCHCLASPAACASWSCAGAYLWRYVKKSCVDMAWLDSAVVHALLGMCRQAFHQHPCLCRVLRCLVRLSSWFMCCLVRPEYC